jgi:hypothetical protein
MDVHCDAALKPVIVVDAVVWETLEMYVLPATLTVPCTNELTTVPAVTPVPLIVIPTTSAPDVADVNVIVGAPVMVVDAIVLA